MSGRIRGIAKEESSLAESHLYRSRAEPIYSRIEETVESLAKGRSAVDGNDKELGVVGIHAKEKWAKESPAAIEPSMCRCRGPVAVPWQRHRLESPVWWQELSDTRILMKRILVPRDRPYEWPPHAERYRGQP
ncbi:unnamed protein product [Schistocephalus solidus]|uniref:Uncharacterized protein n=1 Tax=Schistocephalus solidus TaxID=70667 RepID=A0A183S963_SCHSO|nr:unnamed protein product [Schistocephalus solidus]